jgi:hypothetical protein
VFNDNGGRDFNFFEDNFNGQNHQNGGNRIYNLKQWSLANNGNNINQGNYTLVSKTFTTLLELSPASIHQGLRFGFYNPAGTLSTFRNTAIQAAAYSAAFILRNVYTTDKDIDGEEIRILKLRQQHAEQKINLLFADKLVNGSGFCDELHNHLDHYFNLCFDNTNPFAARILSDENLECDTASYKNLMNYRNQKFHPILDWRLGLTYLRMLKSTDIADILFVNENLHEFKNYNGQNNWKSGFQNLFQTWVTTTNLGNYNCVNTIPLCERKGDYIVGIHPLWDIDDPAGTLANVLQQLNGANKIIFVDSFNLIRRPGACYKAAIDGLGNNNQPIP